MTKVVTIMLKEEHTKENLKIENLRNIPFNSYGAVSDIDNTLLDLLKGIEDNIEGYSKNLQESYSFSTRLIQEVAEPSKIYNLFKNPEFFRSLEPTRLLNLINTRERYRENLIIFTAEPSVDCFLAKAERLEELLTNVGNVKLIMYEGNFDGQELAKREEVYNSIKDTNVTIIDDHPLTIEFAFRHRKHIIIPNHLYTRNTISRLEYSGVAYDKDKYNLIDI